METPKQLLPKDILVHLKKVDSDEAEKAIMDAVKRHAVYSHSNHSNQWMNPSLGNSSSAWAGNFTTTSYSTAVPWR